MRHRIVILAFVLQVSAIVAWLDAKWQATANHYKEGWLRGADLRQQQRRRSGNLQSFADYSEGGIWGFMP